VVVVVPVSAADTAETNTRESATRAMRGNRVIGTIV
jgi:hypothetical protein